VAEAILPLAGRRLLFVGGKGGVGKSTVASALALRLAEGGERVLLVSTDPAHSLGDIFDIRVGESPRELISGLSELRGLEVNPEEEVERYLARVKGNMRDFVRPAMYGEVERQIELARESPGAQEAALLERVAELMDPDPEEVDRVIFDTAPTGHTLRLLALPELMTAWTEGLLRSRERSDSLGGALERLTRGGSGADEAEADEGPSGDRARRIREVLEERRRRFARAGRLLLDTGTTAFLLVLIPEKLPILESRKALEVLRKHRVPVAGMVVNRVLPSAPLGDFLEERREQEAAYLARIEREFGSLPRVQVPLLPRDVEGVEGLRQVGAHLL